MNVTQKTAFLVISVSAKINFVLRSDLPRILKQRGYRVVVISPFSKEEAFQKEFGSAYILEPFTTEHPHRAAFLDHLRNSALAIRHPRMQKVQAVKARMNRRFATARVRMSQRFQRMLLFFIPTAIRSSRAFWDRAEDRLIRNNEIKKLFQTYDPNVVIMDGQQAELLVYCRKFSVPSLFIDMNIDALLSRLAAPLRPVTKVAVIGDLMRKEAMEVHGVAEENVVMVGSLRYDHYFRGDFPVASREETLRYFGADSSKRLLFFATIHPLVYPESADIVKIILEAIKKDEFHTPCQLLVSFFPFDKTPYAEIFKGEKNIILRSIDENIPKDSVANLLRWSDVVLGIGTTMSLEAAAVGTPSIWVGFDGFTVYNNPKDSIKGTFQMDHLRYCIEDGGVPVAENRENLIRLINRYLENRDADKEKRDALLRKLYYKPDGHAAERIADVAVEITRSISKT